MPKGHLLHFHAARHASKNMKHGMLNPFLNDINVTNSQY